jgi:hypothetical protein
MRDDDVEALQAEVVWLVAILVEVLVEFLVWCDAIVVV